MKVSKRCRIFLLLLFTCLIFIFCIGASSDDAQHLTDNSQTHSGKDITEKEILDGDLTIEEGGRPYQPTEEERLISEMKDQSLTKALKFKIDFYAEKGIDYEEIKSLYPQGIDKVRFLEYLNAINKKRPDNFNIKMSSLLIHPYQYDNKFYELQTSAKVYGDWIEEAQQNLYNGTWIVMELLKQKRLIYMGIDCFSQQNGYSLVRYDDVTKKGLTYSWIDAKKLYEQKKSGNRFIEVWN